MQHPTIVTDFTPPMATLTLNRPEVHNALHMGMIRELSALFRSLEKDQKFHLVRLNAAGYHFSSGADLNWMREAMNQDAEQLRTESLELADLFRALRDSRLIVVTSVRGKAMGGAVGLVAASDIVVAEQTASFAFPEVRLGLIPATIAPFVIQKLGYSRTAELMLTGRVFTAEMGLQYGLIHYICNEGELDGTTEEVLKQLRSNGPEAISSVKELLRKLYDGLPPSIERELTATLIAKHRVSDEGQEGMKAFFDKRNPFWHESS
jgi:methylglutaconyl-CoA hydratase